jgi:hypothetical protein
VSGLFVQRLLPLALMTAISLCASAAAPLEKNRIQSASGDADIASALAISTNIAKELNECLFSTINKLTL